MKRKKMTRNSMFNLANPKEVIHLVKERNQRYMR
jgi:hypothetical protein